MNAPVTAQKPFSDAAHGMWNERPLVNYVWINPQKVESAPDSLMCGVPLQNFDLAIENANRYPNADFQIWLDFKLIDDLTSFWVSSIIASDNVAKNIAIKNLQDIPAYANDDFFVPLKDEPLYRFSYKSAYLRADAARVIVLGHHLTSDENRRFVAYSDMDCPDLKLADAIDIVRRKGFILNALVDSDLPSNGYFVLDKRRSHVREAFMVLVDESLKGAKEGFFGYHFLTGFLSKVGGVCKEEPRRECYTVSHVVLPDVGSTLPINPVYQALGIN